VHKLGVKESQKTSIGLNWHITSVIKLSFNIANS